MKNYKKENDFKRIGGITLVVFLCAVCTTTTLASGFFYLFRYFCIRLKIMKN